MHIDEPVAAVHPNGPRSFATFLRDNVPLPPEALAELLALDVHHPTLSAMRATLGLELDISRCADAARAAWGDPRAILTRENLGRVLDAMYRAIRCVRMVRIEVGDSGPVLTRQAETISVRDGERLLLLVLCDNATDDAVRCSTEARGTAASIEVEPHRTASFLLDAGPMPSGSYFLALVVSTDARAATIDLPIESAPSGTFTARVVDEETGEPTAARVYLEDDVGAAWPAGTNIRRDRHGAAWFHADGAFEAIVAGHARVRAVRGLEYEARKMEIAVTPDSRTSAELRLRRWSHMKEEGWRSGDVHVHLHYGGEYLLEPEDAALAQRAEDVHFLNMMVANQGSGWVHDAERFEGAPHALSDGDHILRWGEEYRNDFYGHMCMYGIAALVPPIYSGFRFSEHPHDWPANAEAARACRKVGGALSYAHPLFGAGDSDRVFGHMRTVEAKELPVDAALGVIDAVDVMSYPSHNLETARLWYRLLNCGLRLAATAGTDTFMNQADSGMFSNPPAGVRVFARVAGAFTTESWCEAIRAGRTFVTNGPVLRLEADGRAIGDELRVAGGSIVHIEASGRSASSMERIELIADGEVVANASASADGSQAALVHDLPVQASGWIALRVVGPPDPRVLDDALFAHTSPIYVTVDDARPSSAADAAYFVDWIERLIAMAEQRGRYATDADRAEVLALFREAQAYYQAMA